MAGRYALAVFDLAKEGSGIKSLEADVGALEGALKDSAEFRDLISSPVYSREDQASATAAIAAKMKLSATLGKTLGLMASIVAFSCCRQPVGAEGHDCRRERRSDRRSHLCCGTDQGAGHQAGRQPEEAVGKDVKLNVSVDESLIGGLVVKVGSKMIDTSIRAKLASLQNVMKEVGIMGIQRRNLCDP